MDWQCFSRKAAITTGLVAVLALSSCGRHAVKASEKAYLTDRAMAFDDDPAEAASDARIERCRQGSTSSTRSGGECR